MSLLQLLWLKQGTGITDVSPVSGVTCHAETSGSRQGSLLYR